MAFHLTVSVPDEQKRFIDDRNLSPSQLIQDKINEIMKETDPEQYQQTILSYEKNRAKGRLTPMQKALSQEDDFAKRKLLVFQFLDALGIDTHEWKERRDLEPWKFDQVI